MTSEKPKTKPLIRTPYEKKLLRDLFAVAPKVVKVLTEVLQKPPHFTSAEMDLLTRLITLFSEVSRRPIVNKPE
jgi:hypothetical protein